MRLRGCLLAALVLWLTSSARAEDPMLPVEQQVPLLLKVLTYERSLMGSGTALVKIGYLYDPGLAESRAEYEAFERSFLTYADRTLRGHPVALVPIPFEPGGGGGLPPDAAGIRVLYVPASDPRVLPVILPWTRDRHVLSATPVEQYVRDGLSLGLVVRLGRTGVTINATASAAESLSWEEDFLRLCRVLR